MYRSNSPPLLNGERLLVTAQPRDWSRPSTFLLLYPHSYPVGMSNLGYQFLLQEMLQNRKETFLRAFPLAPGRVSLFPPPATSPAPQLVPSGQAVASVPVWLVSLSFEADQLHLLRLLRDVHVPLRPGARREGQPLIVVGGAAVSGNPYPALAWADVVVVGDGEPVLPRLVDALSRYGLGKASRADTVGAVRDLPGVLAFDQPHGGDRWRRAMAPDLDSRPVWTAIASASAVFRDSVLLELTRGCGHGCRFCLTHTCFRPVRHLSRDAVNRIVDQVESWTGLKAGLVGASLADHAELAGICADLTARGIGFATSSLRLDRLDGDALAQLATGGSHTLTFAPEAGSECLRRSIGKPLADSELDDSLARLAAEGPREVKLYFMVGLPGETDEDVSAIVDTLTRARRIFAQCKVGRMLKVGVAPFVPKPGTPFQWAPFAGVGDLEQKLRKLRRAARQLGIRFTAESARASEVEALLAGGSTAVGEALIDFVSAERDRAGAAAFRQALGGARGALAELRREKSADHVFPWDALSAATAKSGLRRQFELASRSTTEP